MSAALALSRRGLRQCAPNPNVGCIIVRDGHVVGRGWTQTGGRPHAEAMAVAQAGSLAHGATAYVTLEPCFHASTRGPRCCDVLADAGIARVVVATQDPDPRTNGQGIAWLEDQGIVVTSGVLLAQAQQDMAGFFTRALLRRPMVTLKLATSLDGCIALANGSSRWITGPAARAHAHGERARHDAILVGRGTLEADQPALDVRLPGLKARAPKRVVLGHGTVPDGWTGITAPEQISALENVDSLLVEGGAGAAAAFLKAGLVDRLLLYRAPLLIGGGRASLGDIGLTDLAGAHGRWQMRDARTFGPDRMELYLATHPA